MAMAGRLGLVSKQLYVNLEGCGNTSSASVPIALDKAIRDGRLVAEPAWASSADGEIGALGVVQAKCFGQSFKRFGVWKAPSTALKVRDAAHAEACTLGKLCLR
jgi:hypothetical protein